MVLTKMYTTSICGAEAIDGEHDEGHQDERPLEAIGHIWRSREANIWARSTRWGIDAVELRHSRSS